MGSRQVGTVAALFRYPVKSMLSEKMTELMVGSGGVIGDRAWALREIVNGRIVSAKKLPQTFQFRAVYPPNSSSPAIRDLRLVHRGLRHRGPERRKGAARRVECVERVLSQ